MKSRTRIMVSASMFIPLALGLVGCSASSAPEPKASPSASSAAKESSSPETKSDINAAATVYSEYLNGLYNSKAEDIQAAIQDQTTDANLTEDEKKAIVTNLQTSFPQIFGAVDVEGLTNEQAATFFYGLYSFVFNLNQQQVIAKITVPDEAVILDGDKATIDSSKVTAAAGEATLKVDESASAQLVKKNNQWLIVPPAELIPAA